MLCNIYCLRNYYYRMVYEYHITLSLCDVSVCTCLCVCACACMLCVVLCVPPCMRVFVCTIVRVLVYVVEWVICHIYSADHVLNF